MGDFDAEVFHFFSQTIRLFKIHFIVYNHIQILKFRKEDFHIVKEKNILSDRHGKRRRGVQVLTLVLDHTGLNTGRSEEIYRIIQSHNKKNLKAIKQDMDKQMGRTQSSAYYKALHPVLRLVKEL